MTDITAELLDAHGGIAAGRDTRRVDSATWALVRQVFPHSRPLDAALYAAALEESKVTPGHSPSLLPLAPCP